MRWLTFGRAKKAAPPPMAGAATTDAALCVHTALAPHWERIEDIGHEDRATSFICDACHSTFDAVEGRRMRDAAASRVRELLS